MNNVLQHMHRNMKTAKDIDLNLKEMFGEQLLY